MTENYREPWKEDGWAVVDASGEPVVSHDAGVTGELRLRIIACVNFCQHLPTELIEEMTAAGIGPATLAQWVRRNPTFISELYSECIECGSDDDQQHEENCLLGKCLGILSKWDK